MSDNQSSDERRRILAEHIAHEEQRISEIHAELERRRALISSSSRLALFLRTHPLQPRRGVWDVSYTHLLAAGVSPLLVQTYLGWTSEEAKILTRVQASYTALRLLNLEDVAKAIDGLYGPKQKKQNIKVG